MLKYKTDWAKEALAAQTRSGAASVHQGDVGGDSARAGEGERGGERERESLVVWSTFSIGC